MTDVRHDIEEAPGALPVVGHAVAVLRDPLRFLTSWTPAEGLGRVRLGRASAILVYEPGLVHQVLMDDRTFDKGGPMFDRAREIVGNGLATCPHGDHRRQRRLVQPSFHPSRLPGYAALMAEQIHAATGTWRDGQVLDVGNEMMRISAQVAIATMFGIRRDDAEIAQLTRDVRTVVAGAMRRAVLPPPLDRLPTPGNRRFWRAHRRLLAQIETIVTRRRAGEERRGDLMSVLLDDAASTGGPPDALSAEESADQVMTFLIAGTDTVANTLAWALHTLAEHPAVEERLHREVDAALADGAITYDRLPELASVTHVIRESLRLYPPAWLLTRLVTRDTELAGHPLPAGSVIAFSPYLLHHSRDTFPDPDRFDPDRWAGNPRGRVPRGGFVPFGGGARKCIGESFAMTEGALVLAAVAARWRLRAVPGATVRPGFGLVLTPNGLRMRATARA